MLNICLVLWQYIVGLFSVKMIGQVGSIQNIFNYMNQDEMNQMVGRTLDHLKLEALVS